MKKIIAVSVTLFLFFILLGINVNAQQEEKNNAKSTDIKVHKKQLISDEERKSLDELAKGKMGSGARSRVFQPLATGIVGEPIPTTGERYAIVVGLANYNGTANDLCPLVAETDEADVSVFPTTDPRYYCQDYDSIHMKDALVNQYGYNPANITILRDSDATKASIVDAMNSLQSKLDGDDEVVFFYSGHGVSGNYYGIVDGEKVDEAIYTYDGQFIWDDDLKAWADSLSVYREAFVFDMCLAGGMNDIAGVNRVIAMSSVENQSSWTYTLGGGGTSTSGYTYSEGLFSHYFVVSGMTNMQADSINLLSQVDSQVTAEEAFSYTYPIIKTKQAPVLSDKFTNDLLLGH
ncbi:caspase family protein [Patescibacteria group bacterium]|nr:MAG: caspase family protein [Patescibacteria group bacterium]